MTYIAASRDALAKGLYAAFEWSGCEGSAWERRYEETREKWRQNADALTASGAVIDAATLADDEALRWRLLDWCVTHDVEEPGVEGSTVRHVLRALAAALTERAQ